MTREEFERVFLGNWLSPKDAFIKSSDEKGFIFKDSTDKRYSMYTKKEEPMKLIETSESTIAIKLMKDMRVDEKRMIFDFDITNSIDRVIFNNPATIVIWNDGTKTVVKAYNEEFDKEKGLAMAIIKFLSANKGNFNNVFKKFIPELTAEEGVSELKEVELTVGEVPESTEVESETVQETVEDLIDLVKAISDSINQCIIPPMPMPTSFLDYPQSQNQVCYESQAQQQTLEFVPPNHFEKPFENPPIPVSNDDARTIADLMTNIQLEK